MNLAAFKGVALRKESVDRNVNILHHILANCVALRKESVDRNGRVIRPRKVGRRSLSARRAWIEIKVYGYGDNKKIVALRKESVDRNTINKPSIRHRSGRSPQGERG